MSSAVAMKLAGKAVRILLAGWPKGGKTGAIVALLKAGYKVRVIDFEGNYDVLLNFTPPEFLPNLDIFTVQDRLTSDGTTAFDSEAAAKDMAFSKALQQMKDWKTTDENGNAISLGASYTWGADTVVVLDSLTGLGESSFRRAMRMLNRKASNVDVKAWGLAVKEQVDFVQWLARDTNHFHLVVLAHWAMIGPETPMSGANEADEIKDLKAQIATEKAALLPTKLFPKGVTKDSSRSLHKNLPTMLEARRVVNGTSVKRWIFTESEEEADLALPVPGAEKRYPIETGLATIFGLLGAKAPGSEKKEK